MSIDAKIAEIMEESKLLGLGEEVIEEELIEEEVIDEELEEFITEEEYDYLDECLFEEGLTFEELEDFMMSEDFEQLDELSKATLGSYISKASGDIDKKSSEQNAARDAEAKNKEKMDFYDRNKKNSQRALARVRRDRVAPEGEDRKGKIERALRSVNSKRDTKSNLGWAKRHRADYTKNKEQASAEHKKAADIGNKINKRNSGIDRAADKILSSKVKKESLDVSADVDALMFGESLSEEFREKAATIFESAVVVRVKEEVARLEEEFEEKLAEQVDSITEGLVDKIDGYLDYVVEQWIENNEIALEHGLKSEIMESFITGMKGLFEEHYIDVPEEKYDVIGEMEAKIDALESKLDEQFERNVELKKSLSESVRKEIVSMVSEGLTDTESEKFAALVNELSYDDQDSFKVKVQTIRENYFTGKSTSTLLESVVTDSPVEEINEGTKYTNIDPTVAAYAQALKQYNN